MTDRLLAARRLLDLALDRPGRLAGGARLVCVDGCAGSGKTTLAAALERAATARGLGLSVVHMDDLYPGWSGLPRLAEQTTPLVRSLATAGTATYRRYDWERDEYAEQRRVDATDLVVLEGVGSADPAYDDLVSLRVVVTAPPDVRLTRGLERDGEALRGRWVTWMDQEQLHLARTRARERADVVVDGTSGTVSPGPAAV